jgi:hypothetical protein
MGSYLSRHAARLARKNPRHAIGVRACLTIILIAFAVFLAALVVPSHGAKLTTFYRQGNGALVCDLRTDTQYRYVPPVTRIYTLTDLEKNSRGFPELGSLMLSHSPWDYGTAAGTLTVCYE